MRDSVKTAIGLLIIGGIVVATFLYGNSQRQSQLRHDQELQNQQTKATSASPSVSASASASAKSTPTPTPAVVDGAETSPGVIPDTGATQDGLIGLAALVTSALYWRQSQLRVRRAIRVRV